MPALNTNATFIDDLADAVVEALPYVGSLQRSAAASLSSSLSSGNALVPLGERMGRGRCCLPCCCHCCLCVGFYAGGGLQLGGGPVRPCGAVFPARPLMRSAAAVSAAELHVTAGVRAARRCVRRGWLGALLQLAARFNAEGPL